MFRGNHPAKVDEKGRLKLPAAFKQLLDAQHVTQFYVTSSDVEHGFSIPETGVNTMVTPGWVSSVSHTFNKAGTFLLICNEYCGAGHQLMASKVEVQ